MRCALITVLLIGCQPKWAEVTELEEGTIDTDVSEENSGDDNSDDTSPENNNPNEENPDEQEPEQEEEENLEGAGSFTGDYAGSFSIEVDYGTGWPDSCEEEFSLNVNSDGSWSSSGDCNTWWSGAWTIGFDGDLIRESSAEEGELDGVISYDNVYSDEYHEASLIGYSEFTEGNKIRMVFEWSSSINGAAVSGVAELYME